MKKNKGKTMKIIFSIVLIFNICTFKAYCFQGSPRPVVNLALHKPAIFGDDYNSDLYPASNGNNGVTSSGSDLELAHSGVTSTGNWWRVDLGANYDLERLDIYNRTNCCMDRLNNAKVYIARANLVNPNVFDATKMTEIGSLTSDKHQILDAKIFGDPRRGKYVYIKAAGSNHLNFLEVEVYGINSPLASFSARSSVNNEDSDRVELLSKSIEPMNEFRVYPNPVVDGEFRLSTPLNGIKMVTIFDMQGQQVYSKQISSEESVKVSDLSTGIYIIKILENNVLSTQKLVIE